MSKPATGKSATGIPLRRRSLTLVASSADKASLTVGMIVATEAPTAQWIPDPAQTGDFDFRSYIKALEILDMTGVDFSRAPGMPFCDSHRTETTGDVLGSVLNLRVEGVALVAEAKFRKRHAELVDDIADGHLQQVSVGYEVFEYELVGRDETTGLPIVRAIRWCPHEVSLVAVGADAGAVMRSQDEKLYAAPTFKRSAADTPSKEKIMDIETALATAEEAKAAADAAIAALADVSEEGASDEVKARLAKLRARAEGDDEPTGEPAADTASVSEEDKKAETEARAMAKRRGKETEAFIEGLVGLKRGKELKALLGDFIAARAIAAVSAPTPTLIPVADKTVKTAAQRSADLAKDLDPATLFARRKRGFVAAK
ncbi:hypothetical protein HFO32_22175 [Rhizobium leguminosarum]|uniref:hypothetical protein n=1 Tax=Rhizobium leguminosarum TaxID=384 RepID=UPI001C98B3EB|nr:hypothetical protein [Rhizobium leguminosarum]MBY5684833.1 hypothetical protein [Rhizobium leguminosarum]